jgi:deoxyribose-phosphate aldolase
MQFMRKGPIDGQVGRRDAGGPSEQIASYIEHTLLKPDATAADIEKLCAEARQYRFLGVCINSGWVRHARLCLQDTDIKVVSVAGFPLGAASTAAKCLETKTAISDGTDEIDVVLNIGRLKQGDDSYVQQELREVVQAADGHPVKVILETCLLDENEKIRACRLAVESGACFVKTSTGFSSGGATVADVALMRKIVGPKFGVKAAGGIRNAETAIAMIGAGANRLGASAGIAIIRSLMENTETK